jgi:proteasome lid subunit RPN8/RPN11
MLTRLARLLGLAKPQRREPAQPPRPMLVITQACMDALHACLSPEIRKGDEGIAYLLGRTDGTVTLAVSAFRPKAKTTPGSFHVEPVAMAVCVRTAARLGMQIVAQVHTHPGAAYHSDGDVEGTRIRYTGYASVVLPDYGRCLPRLDEAAVYFFCGDSGWTELDAAEVLIVPEACHG